MLKSFKNLWTLNTEEAIVAGILRAETRKDVEIFIPLNAQMKDVDLVLVNTANKKTIKIQVKGSRAYEGNKKQIKKYGYGSYSWIDIKKNTIDNSISDYFIFLIYTLEQFNENSKGSVYIKHHTITISKDELRSKISYKKIPDNGLCRFYIWVNPKTKQAFDLPNSKRGISEEYYSNFLDKKGFEKLNKDLK